MTTPVQDQPSSSPAETPVPPHGWKRIAFIGVNLLLAFHLFAIVICPASSEPSSPLVQSAFGKVSWYLDLLYLDHGFRFFVPDPGASTLVEYTAELPDGTMKTGRFPNREIFPRLLYHRYFMLSEFLGNGPAYLTPYVKRAFARNICRETGAVRVTLKQIVHEMPLAEDYRNGMSLNDSNLFTETPLGTFSAESLNEPYVATPTEIGSEPMAPTGPVALPDQSEEQSQ